MYDFDFLVHIWNYVYYKFTYTVITAAINVCSAQKVLAMKSVLVCFLLQSSRRSAVVLMAVPTLVNHRYSFGRLSKILRKFDRTLKEACFDLFS